jgi:hypothetical protein
MRVKLERTKAKIDSILYPVFVGFGLIAVTFGTLKMGVGTDKQSIRYDCLQLRYVNF